MFDRENAPIGTLARARWEAELEIYEETYPEDEIATQEMTEL
jgi:hypothetical protein